MARILIVEDDPLVREGFVRLLDSAGYLVTGAGAGEAGVKAAKTTNPDLILLDVGLPGIDGLECADRLRKLGLRTPIIFLTAHGSADFVARAIDQQAYAYLVKPISGSQLLPLVKTALSSARVEQEKEEKLLAALANSRQISAAVGMLAERHAWSLEQAFQGLRMRARSEGRDIVEVAAEVTSRTRQLDGFNVRNR
jgi:DNA-binding response OmpR family regulator